MTSTYLHVNCVVGVACAEAFANKNIAPGDPASSLPTVVSLQVTKESQEDGS